MMGISWGVTMPPTLGYFGLPVYYLIRPKQALLERSQYAFLVEPQLWFYEQAHQRGKKRADYALQVKILFLARVHTLRETFNKDENQFKATQEIMDDPPYDENVFDTWWTIEALRPGPEFHEELRSLPLASLEAISKTNNSLVDPWLARIIEMRKQQERSKKDNDESS